METKQCIACGMPMVKPDDFAANDPDRDYCVHCARPDGSMQSYTERKTALTAFIVRSQGFDEAAAARLAEDTMRLLPAWAGQEDTKEGGGGDV